MKVNGIVKQWRYPEASERGLTRSLQEFSRDLVVFAREKLSSMRFDASDADINQAEHDLESYAYELIATLSAGLPALALAIYKFNSKQFVSMAKSTGGKKIPYVIMLDSLGPLANEMWYQEKSDQWMSLTDASFRKLANDIISDWSVNLRNLNLHNAKSKEVNELIEQRYKVYTGWSANRARGIVSTWNSLLMRQRLDDAGVTHYFWHGKLDERERLQHLKWEGKRIEIDSDHVFPGEPYGCRCWAVPDFTTVKEVNYNVT